MSRSFDPRRAQSRPRVSRRRARTTAIAATILAAAALVGCADDQPLATTAPDAARVGRQLTNDTLVTKGHHYYVNPATGNDGGTGSQAQPFKTVTRALALAVLPDTVHLAAGTYGAAFNGEKFAPEGTIVRNGVTILGAVNQSGFPSAVLFGGGGVGLKFEGNAVVRDVNVGGAVGFGAAMYAKQGYQTLTNVAVGPQPGGIAVTDGRNVSGGLVLRGTADATLAGGTVFLMAGKATGVDVSEQARFTMTGGSMTAGGPNCLVGGVGIHARNTAQVSLTSAGATMTNLGTALILDDSSQATLVNMHAYRAAPSTCVPGPAVAVNGASTLALDGGVLQGEEGIAAVGITTSSSGPLALTGTSVVGYTLAGIRALGKLKLDVKNSSFLSNHIGIDAASAITTKPGEIRVAGGTFNSVDGVGIIAPVLQLRNATVKGRVGVLFAGKQITGTQADLGTATSPGGNTIQASERGVGFFNASSDLRFVQASGNLWHPNTQGSNAFGFYKVGRQISGISSLAKGKNFTMDAPSSVIQF